MTEGSTMAVDGVSLTVAEGEIVGLIGPNGAAKTFTGKYVEGMRTPRPSIERPWCSCSAIGAVLSTEGCWE